jgi:hypothetical protein
MLPFAHLGIGANLVRPWWKSVPLSAILIGAILPDLLDKTIYYVPWVITGKHGSDLGPISGTRTIGHSLVFLLLIFAVAAIPGEKRKWWRGLGLGVATHLLLDNFAEPLFPFNPYSSRIALFYPLYDWKFPDALYKPPGSWWSDHLGWFSISCEVVGMFLLWRLWRSRHSDQIEAN